MAIIKNACAYSGASGIDQSLLTPRPSTPDATSAVGVETSGVDVPVAGESVPLAAAAPPPAPVLFFFFLFFDEEAGARVKTSTPVSVILHSR